MFDINVDMSFKKQSSIHESQQSHAQKDIEGIHENNNYGL